MAEISGGELLARMLQAEGVEKVFGIIDGTYFGFYEALHRIGIEIVELAERLQHFTRQGRMLRQRGVDGHGV